MSEVSSQSRDDVPACMTVLGIPVHLVDIRAAVNRIVGLRCNGQNHMVFVRDVASLMAAVDTPPLRALHYKASLIVPDGAPLVWAGKLKGHGALIGRVPGADLVDAVCTASLNFGGRHFFYGGKPGVAELMAERLSRRHPGLVVAGTLSPPMLNIDAEYTLTPEGINEVEAIKATEPDFIWVGISSPKQEYWMNLAGPLLGCGICLGVGAAFDYHSGKLQRAPGWMRNNGLEWLYRLVSEPQRLWHRYLVLAPRFVFMVAIEQLARLNRRYP